MEAQFLKAHQEREEARRGRAREVSEAAAERQRYEEQAAAAQRRVREAVDGGRRAEALEALAAYRALTRDAAHSMQLTSYDTARANASVAELEALVDAMPAPGGGGAAAAEGGPATRRFKFSGKAKSALSAGAAPAPAPSSPPPAPEAEAKPEAPAACGEAARAALDNDTYGPCEDATVRVRAAKAVFVKGCRRCVVLALPTAGSLFVSDCEDCAVYAACHQLRLKNCRRVQVYVWCASTPIIESCEDIATGPYRCWRGLLRSAAPDGAAHGTHAAWVAAVGDMEASARTEDNYKALDDFQWLRRTASPHWRVLPESEWRYNDDAFDAETE